MSVSSAIRNRPGVSDETRARILECARQLNYQPDSRVNSWLATVRDTKKKELLPIAWLNIDGRRDIWQTQRYLAPYYDGASRRCEELGYRLELFSLENEMTSKRLGQILYHRNIQGVIIAPPQRQHIIHLRLNWQHFAAISFEKALVVPHLFQVAQDSYYNLMLALKMLRRFGYRRIGLLLDQQSDRRSYHACQAAYQYFQMNIAPEERVPIFISKVAGLPKELRSWMRKYRIDAVAGRNDHLVEGVRSFGYRVPEEVGVVHLSLDGDCEDWAGIWSRKDEIGATTVDLLVGLMQNNQFGLPKVARETLLRGIWHPGNTLVPRKKAPRGKK
jgi:LacI family transcriptional regulator